MQQQIGTDARFSASLSGSTCAYRQASYRVNNRFTSPTLIDPGTLMKRPSSFVKLPLRFDPEQLAKEALQFTEEDWTCDPLRHHGNAALALVSVDGKVYDRFEGPMLPIPYPGGCPYAMQVIATFQTVVGRSRCMWLSQMPMFPRTCEGFICQYAWKPCRI
jgi:hypothetical protein